MKQKPKWKTWHKVVLTVLAAFFILLIVIINKSNEAYQAALTPAQKDSIADVNTMHEERQRRKQLYETALVNLRLMIKKDMNDPGSFEMDQQGTTWVVNNDTTLTILMKYRGKNGFGALMVNYAKATTDKEGNITSLKISE